MKILKPFFHDLPILCGIDEVKASSVAESVRFATKTPMVSHASFHSPKDCPELGLTSFIHPTYFLQSSEVLTESISKNWFSQFLHDRVETSLIWLISHPIYCVHSRTNFGLFGSEINLLSVPYHVSYGRTFTMQTLTYIAMVALLCWHT